MDAVYPFSLFQTSQKGRLVLLDNVARSILVQHQYPKLVNHYLLELMSLISIMGSDPKTKALTTLQITADKDSPITMLVVDLEHAGGMRAYGRFDKNKLVNCSLETPLNELFLKGHMLFNIDFEKDNNRYQAAVDLSGKTLTESMAYYCQQSDQIPSQFNVHIKELKTDDLPEGRLASGIMLQQLPIDPQKNAADREQYIDEWTTSVHFMKTLKNDEALSNDLGAHKLLYRLFHDANLNEYTPRLLHKKCRCSLEKVEKLIKSFPEKEQQALIEDGKITVDCEFCSAVYKIDPATI